MTLPRELSLRNTSEGVRLFSNPVKELEKLRGQAHQLTTELSGELDLTEKLNLKTNLLEVVVEVEWETKDSPNFGFQLTNEKGEKYLIGFDAESNKYYSDRTHSGKKEFSTIFARKIHTTPAIREGNQVKMHLFFDVASAELFADDGAINLTDIFFPNSDYDQLKMFVEGASVKIKQLHVFELHAAEIK